MTDLFNTKDLLTVATVDQAEINTKGYFGDNLSNLIEKVRQGKVETLTDVIPDVTYCFESNNDLHYMFFLPLDKIKNKEPTYRPLQSISELFDFMMPDYTDEGYTTDDMIDLLLGQHYTLKDKVDGTIRHYAVNFLSVSAYGTVILNDFNLTYLFDKFEYRKDGEFVPFGIKEE